jgi:hypothetical protein
MPAPWLGLAVQAIPWDTLLKQAPAILDGAIKLFKKTDTRGKRPKAPTGEIAIQLRDVKQRIEAIEEHEQSNAVVSARIWIALLGAGLSLIIAALVCAITLLHR